MHGTTGFIRKPTDLYLKGKGMKACTINSGTNKATRSHQDEHNKDILRFRENYVCKEMKHNQKTEFFITRNLAFFLIITGELRRVLWSSRYITNKLVGDFHFAMCREVMHVKGPQRKRKQVP